MKEHAGWLGALMLSVILMSSATAAEQERLFLCSVGQSASDYISLDAALNDDGSWGGLRFALELTGAVVATVIEPAGADPRIFFFSNSEGPEGYLAQVRFADEDRSYLLSMLNVPADPKQDADLGGRHGVLTVTEASGSSYDLPCGEIEEKIGYMSQAMACDMSNPNGLAGCDFDKRPTRIQDETIPQSLR
jgi:hypothetical protein